MTAVGFINVALIVIALVAIVYLAISLFFPERF